MSIFYDCFFIIFSIFYIPYLIFKGKLHKDFRERFTVPSEKFKGIISPLWIHAVSVGEVVIAVKITRELKKILPNKKIIISTTTLTGNKLAREQGSGLFDAIFYFPIDLSCIVKNFIRVIKPAVFLIIETELWPNIISEMKRAHVPVILVNGRLSAKSFRNYKRVRFFIKKILQNVELFLMQGDVDAERIITLGACREKVKVYGSIKFDEYSFSDSKKYTKRFFSFREDDNVIIAGSTHAPEEEYILDIYLKLKSKYSNLKLVIVPRHIERISSIEKLIRAKSFLCKKFSDILAGRGKNSTHADIILIDTIGHLRALYNTATIVFVGGSLVKKGGQNPLEPAGLGKPIVFGPHMYNFSSITKILLETKSALMVKDKDDLLKEIDTLLADKIKQEFLGRNALDIIRKNSGALTRGAEMIKLVLERGEQNAPVS
ncbi:3-deoxy-D-manno-octulosonic-acid transferase [Candidatus Omnitrophus magneticus]|uniref:3-deoxy-D-manno-octulosonic acid transferase n=1 Tax=Candidatus Omnitrophus magneticus TaxID=1609969 RepID=A0A0F0CWS9_9BACT|nr:3-deoxy-D-manno-octulosonic-acid transferase [Candidatus Omnitrophus magneticus]